MLSRLARYVGRHHLGLLALFIALGGTSYATVLNVPRNSVGTLQIKRNAVKANKIAPNAVRTAHVLDGSLRAADFRPGQLPQGAKGAKGEKGEKGDRGPAGPSDGFVTRKTGAKVTTTAVTLATVMLPAGKYVIQTHIALLNQSTTAAVAVQCTVAVGTNSLGETVTLQPLNLSQHSLLYFADLSASGQVSLSCRVLTFLTGFTGTEALASLPSVNAVKVENLTMTS